MTVSNNNVTIHVDTRVATSIKIETYKPDILITNKKNKLITN